MISENAFDRRPDPRRPRIQNFVRRSCKPTPWLCGVGPFARLNTAGFPSYRRSVPLTTMSTRRLPQCEHTSRSRQSGTGVSAL
jgi:hypothetical protein